MKTLILLLIIATLAVIWYESLRISERVITHCREICERADLQFLDQTVALVSLSLRRTPEGTPTLFRVYQFEVSELGTDRQRGYVAVSGGKIHHVRLVGREGDTILYQSEIRRVH